MRILSIGPDGARQHEPAELAALLGRPDRLVWVDIPHWTEEAGRLLDAVFDFHPMAIADCTRRNHVPKVHAYPDHVLLVLHAPLQGELGHVHYLELDLLIGAGFLVTVHGPLNPAVPPEAAVRETDAVRARIGQRRLAVGSAAELAAAVVRALVRSQQEFVAELAREVGLLEQSVMRDERDDPQQSLERLFRTRHALLTVRTMAAQGREVLGRLLGERGGEAWAPLVADLMGEYERVRAVTDHQREFLQGVIEFYKTRTDTRTSIAAERLAVIAAVTLPITAVSSVYGMNVIVSRHTHYTELAVVLLVMAVTSGLLLRWARRQGWW